MNDYAQAQYKEYCENEIGRLVIATLPDGRMYSFEITTFGETLENIKKKMVHKYGNVQIKTYPKGTVLIGNKVFMP